MTQRIVVVGGGIAAVRLVEALRRLGSTAAITVIAAETYHPYDRPPLSKGFLTGDDTQPPFLRAHSEWAGWDADLRLGRRAVRVRPDAAVVDLDDGTEVDYDALVVATGAEPRPLPELADRTVHHLRGYDDAIRLRDAMRATGRVVIVGAGFIGCEVAASARSIGVDVSLVDVMAAPLVGVLGADVAGEVLRMHKEGGVDLRMQTTLAEHADLVDAPVTLVAVGVMPSVGWLDGSGIDVANGVLCDAGGRTSVAGVWAIGDVAAWRDPTTGRHRRHEHWTSAGDQAVVVARNLTAAGDESHVLAEVPYFWSDQYGVKIQSLGTPAATDDVEVMTVGPHGRLLAVYGAAGVVTGVVGFGVPRHVMRMRALLAAQAAYADAIAAVTD